MIETYSKIFLDTAPFIYYLEKSNLYYDIMKMLMLELYEGKKKIVTSILTYEEYCVQPYKNHQKERITAFENFIKYMGIDVLEINREIALKAAEIRAEYKGFKAMDALQLASAVISGCDLFLTNDKQLKQYTEIECMIVDELENLIET